MASPSRRRSKSPGSSTSVSDYSILLLVTRDEIRPYKPMQRRASHNYTTQWESPSSEHSTAVTSNAISLFRANQSMHGTNVVARVDLQHDAATGAYTSTSITRLPDFAARTPGLIEASVPGGISALERTLLELEEQRRGSHQRAAAQPKMMGMSQDQSRMAQIATVSG